MVAGIGGGGIVSAVWILTAEIVEVQNRAKWSQALSVTWSGSAIAGPLIGGLFSGESHKSLRDAGPSSFRSSFQARLSLPRRPGGGVVGSTN